MLNKNIKFFIVLVMSLICMSNVFADTQKKYRIAMLADTPEIRDHSFHENVYIGLKSAEVRYKKQVSVDVFGSKNTSEYNALLDSISNKNYDFIITLGVLLSNATLDSAKKYPNTKFISIDGQYNDKDYTPNLASISFNEFQGGYLAGVLAGGLTAEYRDSIKGLNSDKSLGIIKGLNVSPVNRFSDGFIAGVKHSCESCVVKSTTAGTFDDSAKVEKVAKKLYESGVDIIFVVAGSASDGAFQVAQKMGKFTIGTDTDQNFVAPNAIITSALKRNDIVMDQVVSDLLNNRFEFGKNHVYGISQNGVGLAQYHSFDSKIPTELKDMIELSKQDLLDDSARQQN